MRLQFLLLLLTVFAASVAAQPDILYYKFDETSGNVARNDAVPGQGWTNGALSAAPLWNATDPQVPPAAVNNTGQARRMSTGYSMSERNGQAFTIEFWFRTTGGGYQDFCNDSNTFGIWMLNGTIQVNMNGIRLNSSGGQNDGQWRYCALTRDTGNGFTLYWGTTAAGLSTDTANYNMTFSTSAFEMLYWQAAVPATYDGEMDEFRLWGSERTQAELEANRFTSFTTQDLDVFDPSMQFIKHQGDSNYTNVAAGTSTDFTFTVENVRTSGDVTFSPVTLTGVTGCNATVTAQPSSPLAPGATTTFTIQVTPLQAEFSFLVNVNNDRAPDPYQFNFNGMMNTGRPEMLYYRFDEGSGNTAQNDASPGRGNNPATFNNTPTWVSAGNPVGAASAGDNGNTTLPTGFSCTDLPRPEFTLEFWVQRRGNGTNTFCGDNAAFRIYHQNQNLRIQSGPAGGDQDIDTGINLSNNTWTHLAFVANPGVAGLTIYVNGTQQFQNVNYTFPFVDAPFHVFSNSGTDHMNGQIDEFRFWAQARSQAQISAAQNSELIGRMEVQRPAASAIANGGADPLGTVTTGVTQNLTYRLANTGGAGLLLGNPAVSFSGNTNCNVSIVSNPSGILVAGGGNTTSDVDITPLAPGAFSVQLQFASNDPDVPTYTITVSGTATGNAQIQLERPATNVIPHLGNDTVTGAVAGVTNNLTYVIRNPGTLPLDITGQNATAQSNCNVIVGSPTVDPVGAGSTSNLPVDVTPIAAGAFSFTLNITSNAPGTPTYSINVSGNAAVGGEIDIQRPAGIANSIADGGTDTVTGAVAGMTTVLTYTVENLGTADLTLTTPNPVSGNTPVNLTFAAIIQPGSNVLAPSATTTFQVNLTPAAAGAFSLQLAVDSDDLDEGVYNINISGVADPGGEIHVERPAATGIADGGTDPLGGSHVAGVGLVLNYTVYNQGTAALNISGVNLSNFNNCAANVTGALPGSILNGNSAVLQITVTPSAAGAFSFEIDILSDDVNEGTYDILASGTAIPGGEIHLERPVTVGIADGGTDNLGSGHTAGVGLVLDYTVRNQGTALLTVSGVNLGNFTNCTANVTGALPGSIPNGNSAVLQITVTPIGAGAFSFEIDINSDDVDESTYDILADGSASPGGEIQLERPAASVIANGGNDPVPGTVAGVTTQITYTVRNVGTATLTITGTGTAGALVNCGVVVGTPGSSSLAPAALTAFNVDITPIALGGWNFTVEVTSDDTSDPSYTINVSGTAAPGGEIDIQRPAASSIPNGGSDNVPGTVAGATTQITYTVENTGTTDLTITSTGTTGALNNVGVVVGTVGSSVLTNSGAGSTTTFTVDITPVALGGWSFTLEVTSNDTTDPSYIINVSDTAAPGGQIDIQRPASITIPHTGNDPVAGTIAGATTQITYTVENLGTGDLTISGTGTSGALANVGVIVGSVASSVLTPSGAGSTTTFDVDITPIAAGAWSFTLEVTSDDTATPGYLINVSGSALPGGEIGLSRAGALNDGDTDNVGSGHVAGVGLVLNYTVSNTGTAPLTISGVSISGEVNCNAVVTTALPGSINNGASAPLQITVTPTAAGNFVFDFDINSDDQDENPYDIHVDGDALPGGEIDLSRTGSLNDGDTDGLGSGHVAGVGIVLNYTVSNTGSAALAISGVVISNESNCNAVVTTALPASIANGANSPLQITVTPVANGAFSFDFDINSDDQDENPYDIAVDGTAAPGGEIHVERPVATAVLDGTTDNIGTGHVAGVGLVLDYTVYNQGTAALTISSVVISNEVNCNAVVTTALPGSIANGANAPLQITVTPIATGSFSFDFDISNDDLSENPYDVNVDGSAIPGGEIHIERPFGTSISDGGNDDAGSAHVAGAGSLLDYTVFNQGTAGLSISGVSITNESNCNVSVSTALPGSIANGANAPLQLTVTPIAAGAFSFDLDINSDDVDETTYDIHVFGTSDPGGEIHVERPLGTLLADNSVDTIGGAPVAGSPVVLNYTVFNTGTADLTISAINLVAQANCVANVTGAAPTVIAAGTDEPLQITVTPTASGSFSFEIDIVSDDVDEANYDILVQGNAITGGEIDIQRPVLTSIADGGTDTVTGAVAGVFTLLTYTIENLGTADLTLTTPNPVSANTPVNLNFASITQPSLNVLTSSGPNSTTTFQVGLEPANAGAFSLQIVVASDDIDEGAYNINISGTAASGGEIDVQRPAASSIPAGGSDNVGSIPAATPTVLTYTIENSGTSALDLTGQSFFSAINCGVSIGAPSQDPIPNPGTATLDVTVTPGAGGGAWSFTLRINSDDTNEDPYDILVSGSAPSPTSVTNVVVGPDNGGPVLVNADVNGPAASFIDVAVTYTGGLNGPSSCVLLDQSGQPITGNVISSVPANTTITFYWDAYATEGHHSANDYVLTLSPSLGGTPGIPGSSAAFTLDRLGEWSKPYLAEQFKTPVSEHTTVHDPVNNRLIVFGGYRGVNLSNETWELNLGTNAWRQLSPAGTAPSPRREVLSVYDSVNQRMIVFGGQVVGATSNEAFALSLTPGSETWSPIATTSPAFPVARTHGSLVYDAANGRAILFGGYSSPSVFGDTWALDLTLGSETWGSAALAVTGSPGNLVSHASIYDPVGQRMLMLSPYGPLWELTLGGTPTWTQLAPTNAPSSRGYMTAIYDPVRHAMVIQGGLAGSVAHVDCWSLDINTLNWTQLPDDPGSGGRFWHTANYLPGPDQMVVVGGRNAARQQTDSTALLDLATSAWVTPPDAPSDSAGPQGRRGATMAYDAVNDRTLMWGGKGGETYSDLWELDRTPGAQWAILTPTGTSPNARSDAASTVDTSTNRMIVFGGDGSGGSFNDIWALDMTANPPSWQLLNDGTGTAPPARSDAAMAYDSSRDEIVLFGGRGGSTFGDLWIFDLGTNTWSQPGTAGTAPSARYAHGATYDSTNDRFVVFCGRASGELQDVHALDLGTLTWSDISAVGTQPGTRAQFAWAGDATGDHVYLFGGKRSVYQLGDLWELDLTGALATWAILSPANSLPAEREDPAACLDAAGVLIAGTGFYLKKHLKDVWDFDTSAVSPEWVQLALPDVPPNLSQSQGIYDPVANRMLVFSGEVSFGPSSGLWQLDLSAQPPAWSRLTATGTAPRPRVNATMVYDTSGATPRILMYGGQLSGARSTAAAELWALELPPAGTPNWVQLTNNPGNPGPRTEHTAIIDSNGDMVVFGGRNHYGWKLNDVRVLNPVTLAWTIPATSGTAPVQREGARAVLDYAPLAAPARNRMIVFGGVANTGYQGDTFELDLTTWTWTQLTVAGTPPTAVSHHSFVLDAAQDRALLFGGRNPAATDGLYEFDFATDTWTQITGTHPAPQPRWGQVAVWDSSANRMVVAGGYTGTTDQEQPLSELQGTSTDTWYWGD